MADRLPPGGRSARWGPVLALVLTGVLLAGACGSAASSSSHATAPGSIASSPSGSTRGGTTGAGASRGGTAGTLPAAVAREVGAAKQEGTVDWFGLSASPGQSHAMEAGLDAFYGFPLHIVMTSGPHPQIAGQVIQEEQAGVPTKIDLFYTGQGIFSTLMHGGVLQAVPWTKDFGIPAADTEFGGAVLKLSDDPFLTAVIYNTHQVTAAEAPHSYTDLLAPRWKGHITMQSPGFIVYIADALGLTYATRLAQGLGRQQIAFAPTDPDVLTRVGTGEYSVGLGVDARPTQTHGAPVAQAPIDPLIATPWGAAILKHAAHPAAALLLAYYLSSDPGQRTLNRVFGISRLTVSGTYAAQMAAGKKVVYVPDSAVEQTVKAQEVHLNQLLGMHS